MTLARDAAFFAAMGFVALGGFVAGVALGVPLFALGVAMLSLRWRRGPSWPADLGLLVGAGAVSLLVAATDGVGDWEVWTGLGIALIGAGAFGCWRLRPLPAESRAGARLAPSDRPALPHPARDRRRGAGPG
jgi:hypothetical protein